MENSNQVSLETDPLLSDTTGSSDTLNDTHTDETLNNFQLFNSLLADSVPGKSEFEKIVWSHFLILHIPVILSYILQNSIQTVSILIVGRLGPNALSAAAFSYMLAFVTGKYQAFVGFFASGTSIPLLSRLS